MTKDDLVAHLRDIEWEDFEVKTAKSDLPRSCIRVYTDHIEFMNGGAFPLPVNEMLGKIY